MDWVYAILPVNLFFMVWILTHRALLSSHGTVSGADQQILREQHRSAVRRTIRFLWCALGLGLVVVAPLHFLNPSWTVETIARAAGLFIVGVMSLWLGIRGTDFKRNATHN